MQSALVRLDDEDRPLVAPGPDWKDLDRLEETIEERGEDQEIEQFTAELPRHDPTGSYRPERVTVYMGSSGAHVMCAACDAHGVVDEWGAFECENCGFRNTVERMMRGGDPA